MQVSPLPPSPSAALHAALCLGRETAQMLVSMSPPPVSSVWCGGQSSREWLEQGPFPWRINLAKHLLVSTWCLITYQFPGFAAKSQQAQWTCSWIDVSLLCCRTVLSTAIKWKNQQRRNTKMEKVNKCSKSFINWLIMSPLLGHVHLFHGPEFFIYIFIYFEWLGCTFSKWHILLYRNCRGGAPCWGDWCTACEACCWRGGGGLTPSIEIQFLIFFF